MNQREALLEGAKQCLTRKGYGKTTARDITEASGANLGSIGYHFGSKDRLMNLAMLELTSEWGDAIESAARLAPGQTPKERLTTLIQELAARISESRDLHSAGVQGLAQSEFDQELRDQWAKTLVGARCELAAVVLERDSVEPGSVEERGVGFLVYAIVVGLVTQALIDPTTVENTDAIGGALEALGGTV